jgi:hypothetical protein
VSLLLNFNLNNPNKFDYSIIGFSEQKLYQFDLLILINDGQPGSGWIRSLWVCAVEMDQTSVGGEPDPLSRGTVRRSTWSVRSLRDSS